jgi:hypothetical protein
VSNSSGTITSASASLTVVSAMSAISFSPRNMQTGLCVDASLAITFDQPPAVGTYGHVNVYNSTGKLVDTLDLGANPQTRLIGGAPFAYYPVIVIGNTATFYLHQALPYNDYYTVTIDAGVLVDSLGAPFAGFTDANTWNFFTRVARTPAERAPIMVSADGGGDFCTVQGAIDFVPAGNTQPVTIQVLPGTYTGIT